MGIFLRLDDWVIEKTEKFCHWFQKWTGKTNYFLAQVMAVFLFGFFTSYAVEFFLENHVAHATFYGFLGAVYLLNVFWIIPEREQNAFKRLSEKVANPIKNGIIYKIIRLFTLIAVLFYCLIETVLIFRFGNIFDVRFLVFALSLLGFFYFIACDPLPPCSGKLREKIGALFAKSVTITEK